MKLRNINRGLVLGAALVVGTVVYVCVDNARFKESKPEIEETVREYAEAMSQSNVGGADEVKDNWRKLLSDYFTGYSNIHDYGATKNSIMSEMDDGHDDALGRISKAKTEISNVAVSKSGANGANVTFDFSVYYEFTGSSPAYLFFYGISYLDGEGYDDYGNPLPADKDASYGETLSGEAEIYLLETDSGWKIASMKNWGYGMDIRSLDEENSEEDVTDREISDSESENDIDSKSEDMSSEVINGGGELS